MVEVLNQKKVGIAKLPTFILSKKSTLYIVNSFNKDEYGKKCLMVKSKDLIIK